MSALQRLLEALVERTNPIVVKAALGLMGRVGREIRLPLTEITEASRERLDAVLKQLELY